MAVLYREFLASTDQAYTRTETKLETHDISFPVKIQGGIAVFRGILVFPKDVGTSQTKERLERLRLLDGGRSVFVVLLLDGDSSMASLTKLQMEYVASSQNHVFCWLTVSGRRILPMSPSYPFCQPRIFLSVSIT